jgi:hypothetical protein
MNYLSGWIVSTESAVIEHRSIIRDSIEWHLAFGTSATVLTDYAVTNKVERIAEPIWWPWLHFPFPTLRK